MSYINLIEIEQNQSNFLADLLARVVKYSYIRATQFNADKELLTYAKRKYLRAEPDQTGR